MKQTWMLAALAALTTLVGCAQDNKTFENVATELPATSHADGPVDSDHGDGEFETDHGGAIAKRVTGDGAYQPLEAGEDPVAKPPVAIPPEVVETFSAGGAVEPTPQPVVDAPPVNPLRSGGETASLRSGAVDITDELTSRSTAAPRLRRPLRAPKKLAARPPDDPGPNVDITPRSAAVDGDFTPQPTPAGEPPAVAMRSESIELYPGGTPLPVGEEPEESAAARAAPAAPRDSDFPDELASDEDDEDFTTVKVFYGTDRNIDGMFGAAGQTGLMAFLPAAAAGLFAVAFLCAALVTSRRTFFGVLAAAATGCALGLAYFESAELDSGPGAVNKSGVKYGNKRGELRTGICEVSIPRDHRVGELEAPSILRLEVREDARKHVVLRRVEQQQDSVFYHELRNAVSESDHSEIFIFVHGYNVTFENAARRTAQIAYDLKFKGAPVFYSWPSQGGLLKYTVDESNVQWTVPHLKQFLFDVVRRSDARSVNLIAHSMGNRALTSALRELSLELRGEARLFNEVVLAAPDIDAEIFRRDIAPAVVQTGRRVTLYASSSDNALIASKKVHGYPRAGDSGEGLVLIDGIDTIDVSGIDTSLLGHSYYGESDSILADMYHLFHDSGPAHSRRWLRPMLRDGLTYFVFHTSAPATATRAILSPR